MWINCTRDLGQPRTTHLDAETLWDVLGPVSLSSLLWLLHCSPAWKWMLGCPCHWGTAPFKLREGEKSLYPLKPHGFWPLHLPGHLLSPGDRENFLGESWLVGTRSQICGLDGKALLTPKDWGFGGCWLENRLSSEGESWEKETTGTVCLWERRLHNASGQPVPMSEILTADFGGNVLALLP